MESRNSELKPGYKKTKNSTVTGKRLVSTTSVMKTEASPNDTYYVLIHKLSPNKVIVPETMNLTFKFNNSTTKSRFKNNLGRILCEGLTIQIGGEIVYDNRGEGMFETYKDLWKSDSKREGMLEYGIANENIRKIMSGDDSATTSGKDGDVLLEKNQKVLKIKLGKILEGYGPFAPYDMSHVEYRIKLPESDKVLLAQTGETIGTYKLTDIKLEFGTIEGKKTANQVKSEYQVGRQLWYDYTTLLKTLEWKKDSTREVIHVNIPRKSMRGVVLLFTKKNPTDSEEFYNAEIEHVKVSIKGNPNSVYSQGLTRSEIYNEARRFFGKAKDVNNDNLSKLNFLKDKYALVIDLRTVDQEDVVHSGRNIIGVQSGILLEIEKLVTSVDLLCHIFVVADGSVSIKNLKFDKLIL